MRKIIDLTPQDFPEVVEGKFEEWKIQQIEADKKALQFRIIYGVILLAIILTLVGNKIYLGVIPLLLLFGAGGFIQVMIQKTPNELRKQIGISNELLRQDLRR